MVIKRCNLENNTSRFQKSGGVKKCAGFRHYEKNRQSSKSKLSKRCGIYHKSDDRVQVRGQQLIPLISIYFWNLRIRGVTVRDKINSEDMCVSILASFCVWTKSLKCKDGVNKDSTFRVMSVVSACKSEEFQVPCQPSGWSSHPFQKPICPLFHPSGRRVIPSGRQTDQWCANFNTRKHTSHM
jgi:hypothetical protein